MGQRRKRRCGEAVRRGACIYLIRILFKLILMEQMMMLIMIHEEEWKEEEVAALRVSGKMYILFLEKKDRIE